MGLLGFKAAKHIVSVVQVMSVYHAFKNTEQKLQRSLIETLFKCNELCISLSKETIGENGVICTLK